MSRFKQDEFVDISGSSEKNKRYRADGSEKSNKKKTIIIISSIAAAVLAIGAVTGIVLFKGGSPSVNNDPTTEYVFKFNSGTIVSGVSISGKTVEQAKALLEKNVESFEKPIKLSIDANGEISEYNKDDFEYTYNIDAVLSDIKRETEQKASEDHSIFAKETTVVKNYEITATVTEKSIKDVAKKVEEATNKDAENAYVSEFKPYEENRFKYEDASEGYKLNTDDLVEQIKAVFDSGKSESRLIAEVEKLEAEIKIDDLKNNIVKLSTYETVSTNTSNGTSNMKNALKACNGSIIEPGKKWSFNNCTGDSNLESNGYLPAHVITEGKLVDGIGGGICQASSTIYNAAIRANLEIAERHNHLWASFYVPTGLDATIDYPRLDLKLKNTTKYQMFLECKVYNSTTLTVTFWGYKSPSYDFIATENEIVEKTSKDYTVKAWRIYYKDGKEIDREKLGSSTYDDANGYVFINAKNDSGAKDLDYEIIDDATPPKYDEPNENNPQNDSSQNYNSQPQSSNDNPTVSPVVTEPSVQPEEPATEPVQEPSDTEPDEPDSSATE